MCATPASIATSPASPRGNPGPLASGHWHARLDPSLIDTTIGAMLRDAALHAPDAVALVEGDAAGRRRRWTYRELLADAERVAGGLLRHFAPGEHVAVWSPNRPEWVILEYAAALAGLVLVTVNPGLHGNELSHVLRQSRAAGLVYAHALGHESGVVDRVAAQNPHIRTRLPLDTWREWATAAPASLPAVSPQDIACIIFTSGTTGRPKGAMLRHHGLVNNYRFHVARLGMMADDVLLSPIPLFHVGGACMAVLSALCARATLVVAERPAPDLLLDLCRSEGVTAMIGVPTMFLDMLARVDAAATPPSLARIMIGGSSVPPLLIRELEQRLGASVHNAYGQTESGSIICATEPGDTPATIGETVGRPFPHAEIRIVAPDGATQAIGEPGELRLRGYQVMAGYVDMPEETATALDAEGWLHTGDICTMDAEGRVRVVGRLKEMVIRGGENLFPAEIEEAIRSHPDVIDVAVVGVPDARLGEQAAAFVRAGDPALSGDQLVGYLSGRLSREKIPAHWRFVDAFPLTGSGKIFKPALREMFVVHP
ncbi:AMP-binding protein [Sphingomonas sp.]|uniref:class I adenylate-forming enzyme family protein n=1 Tax=Sphingomonas sp. TaxID=28214 RepID=UPI001EBFCBA9|nr:AMP-binding protein [Sphingomonas sp.]MBX3595051.1 AMP-binding protein [Sphingomonas sp.]